MAVTSVHIGAPPRPKGRLETLRTDHWWIAPVGTGLFLGSLTVYAIWAGVQTAHFAVDSYISPLYSPCIAADCGSRANVVIIGTWWNGHRPSWSWRCRFAARQHAPAPEVPA